MLRPTLFALVTVVLAGAAGCGDTHLGDPFGRRVKSALDVQAGQRIGDESSTLDSEDAKAVSMRHHGTGQNGGADSRSNAQTGMAMSPSPSGAGAGGGTQNPSGNTGSGVVAPIRLDAK